MRKLLLLLIVALSIPTQSQSNPESSNNPSNAHPGQQSAQSPPGIAQSDVSSQRQNRPDPKEADRSHSLRDYLGIALTIVIAAAACTQAGCAFWQARIYKRQYDVMSNALIASNTSAEAAAKSVAALEKLERPFLMIELRGADARDEVWIVNKGKVPAQITWYNPTASLRLMTHEEIENMPSHFNYGFLHDREGAQVLNVPWIAPEGEIKLCQFDWIALAPELTIAYQTGQKFAIFLSTVKYRGMVTDRVYESRWCCRWFGKQYGGLRLDGPLGYNSYT